MGKVVLGAFLLHVDARQTVHGKRKRVCAGFDLLVHSHMAKIQNGLRECLDSRNQIIASTELEIFYDSLTLVENQIAEVVRPFRLVLFVIRERAVEALLFSCEKHKSQIATR